MKVSETQLWITTTWWILLTYVGVRWYRGSPHSKLSHFFLALCTLNVIFGIVFLAAAINSDGRDQDDEDDRPPSGRRGGGYFGGGEV